MHSFQNRFGTFRYNRRRLSTSVRLLSIALTILALPILADARTPDGKSTNESYELHSAAPFHEVHVPFKLYGGHIIVNAVLAGQFVDCWIDSGCTGIRWSDQLGVPSTSIAGRLQGEDASGHTDSVSLASLSYLQLGNYLLMNPRGTVTHTRDDSAKQGNPLSRFALLGPGAFQKVVLTIDYEKRELIIRDPGYDFTHQKGAEKDTEKPIILKFRTVAESDHNYGVPCVMGHIGSTPVRLLLDTGWPGSVFSLVTDYVARTPELQGRATSVDSTSFVLGDSLSTRIESVPFSLDANLPLEFTRDVWELPRISPEMDGSIGGDFLSRFRVTFDFPRKRLLLEPYSPDYRKVLAENRPWTRITVGDKEYRLPPESHVAYTADGKIEINGASKSFFRTQVNIGDIVVDIPSGTGIESGPKGSFTLTATGFPIMTILGQQDLSSKITVHKDGSLTLKPPWTGTDSSTPPGDKSALSALTPDDIDLPAGTKIQVVGDTIIATLPDKSVKTIKTGTANSTANPPK